SPLLLVGPGVDHGDELRVAGGHRLVELVSAARSLAGHAPARHHQHDQSDQRAFHTHAAHLSGSELAIWSARSLLVYASIRVMVPSPLSKIRVLVASRRVSG